MHNRKYAAVGHQSSQCSRQVEDRGKHGISIFLMLYFSTINHQSKQIRRYWGSSGPAARSISSCHEVLTVIRVPSLMPHSLSVFSRWNRGLALPVSLSFSQKFTYSPSETTVGTEAITWTFGMLRMQDTSSLKLPKLSDWQARHFKARPSHHSLTMTG